MAYLDHAVCHIIEQLPTIGAGDRPISPLYRAGAHRRPAGSTARDDQGLERIDDGRQGLGGGRCASRQGLYAPC